MNWGRLFGFDKPNVKTLARDGDIDGLIEAARYRDVVRRVDGSHSDAGAAVREAAVLALAQIGGDRASETLGRALGDPADRVRCAAIVALHDRGDDQSLALAVAHLREEDGQALSTAFRALVELRKPGSTSRLVLAIVHREDERPVSETDASILRALREAEGPGADERRRRSARVRADRRARGRGRARRGPARAARAGQRGRARPRADPRASRPSAPPRCSAA